MSDPCPACLAAVKLAEAYDAWETAPLNTDADTEPFRRAESVMDKALVEFRAIRAQHSTECPNQERR